MKTYWFITFTGSYPTGAGSIIRMEGNAACALEFENFMPGVVIRSLEESFRQRVHNCSKKDELSVTITQVTQIDQSGFLDFTKGRARSGEYAIVSTLFSTDDGILRYVMCKPQFADA